MGFEKYVMEKRGIKLALSEISYFLRFFFHNIFFKKFPNSIKMGFEKYVMKKKGY